ncbi:MAG: hypothetical protein GC203_15065 [Phenylobacterium sp.]|uniref:hypothetical protein n=1 Tax=Phenylobacterium sp. TaxID=1871053 RepID=UPI0025E87D58|nr:hypothetical protein [Phenylobacterium sp.]MBI1199179.1 hypothetical protein [Phenylobacterium sp.]
MRPRPQRSNNRQAPGDRFSRGPRVRAGLLMSRQMDFGGLGDVETLMTDEGLTLAPMTADGKPVERPGPQHSSVTVLPTAGVQDIAAGGLAAIVAPGNGEVRSPESVSGFDKLVNTAHAADVPVLAFGESVSRALQAAGYDAPANPSPAALIHKGVRMLETVDEVRDALRAVSGVSPQTHAA